MPRNALSMGSGRRGSNPRPSAWESADGASHPAPQTPAAPHGTRTATGDHGGLEATTAGHSGTRGAARSAALPTGHHEREWLRALRCLEAIHGPRAAAAYTAVVPPADAIRRDRSDTTLIMRRRAGGAR